MSQFLVVANAGPHIFYLIQNDSLFIAIERNEGQGGAILLVQVQLNHALLAHKTQRATRPAVCFGAILRHIAAIAVKPSRFRDKNRKWILDHRAKQAHIGIGFQNLGGSFVANFHLLNANIIAVHIPKQNPITVWDKGGCVPSEKERSFHIFGQRLPF